jgi:NAD(P)-dependent dehydrogenase (short-subunit alcohol dehydrogenase family)
MTYIEELFSLEGKVAIVTGAARGNGKAIAEAFRAAHAAVVAVDILDTPDTLRIPECEYYKCDLTADEQLVELVGRVADKYGRIDVLVNNAGVSYGQEFENYSKEKWDLTYKVNLRAPFLLSQLVAEEMKRNSSGSIINITSLNSELAFPDNPAYVTTKGALKQLTKATAYDLGKYGIRANNIAPGYMLTSMTKNSWNDPVKREERKNRTLLGRWGKSSDLAGAAVFLASDASSFVTGQDLFVDGGWSIKGI